MRGEEARAARKRQQRGGVRACAQAGRRALDTQAGRLLLVVLLVRTQMQGFLSGATSPLWDTGRGSRAAFGSVTICAPLNACGEDTRPQGVAYTRHGGQVSCGAYDKRDPTVGVPRPLACASWQHAAAPPSRPEYGSRCPPQPERLRWSAPIVLVAQLVQAAAKGARLGSEGQNLWPGRCRGQTGARLSLLNEHVVAHGLGARRLRQQVVPRRATWWQHLELGVVRRASLTPGRNHSSSGSPALRMPRRPARPAAAARAGLWGATFRTSAYLRAGASGSGSCSASAEGAAMEASPSPGAGT